MPVLFRAMQRRAPAKVHNRLRPMGQGLIGPQAHLPRLRRVAQGLPAAGTTLLFHDPKVLVLDAAHQVVRHGNIVLIASSPHVVRIAIPGNKVQVLPQIKIIQLVEVPHEIVCNGPVGILAQNLQLHFLKSHHRVGLIPPVIQKQTGIMRVRRSANPLPSADLCKAVRRSVPGDDHLFKALVGLAPEVRSPGCIHRLYGAILLFQPFPKAGQASIAIAMRIKFIINLPGDHVGILPVMFCHGFHQPPHVPVIHLIAGAVVPPGSKALAQAVQIHRIYFGVLVHQPLGRRGCGRAQHGGYAVLSQQSDGFVQPGKIEFSFPRFQQGPGKFAHTHNVDMGGRHHFRIRLPSLSGPVLRIIIHAKIHLYPSPCFSWQCRVLYKSKKWTDASCLRIRPGVCLTRCIPPFSDRLCR